jgi:hypothetical protein
MAVITTNSNSTGTILIPNTTLSGSATFNGLTVVINVASGTTTNCNVSSGGTTNYTISSSKVSYDVLGKKIEINGYRNFEIGLCLALINTNGIEFYLELKKQEITFPNEIGDYLETQLVSYFRNKKIDSVIE